MDGYRISLKMTTVLVRISYLFYEFVFVRKFD